MKIGDEVYVHGYIDEVRKDVVIIRNEGGYFGTVADEIINSTKNVTNDSSALITVSDRATLDSQMQDLIKRIADFYFDGEIDCAVDYIKLMGECIGIN